MASMEMIKRKERRSEVVEVAGSRFRVTGKGWSARGEVMADIRRKKLSNWDAAFLATYVSDAETGESWSYEQWCDADEDIAGPLMSVVLSVSGMDKEDLKRDPKGSSTTEN